MTDYRMLERRFDRSFLNPNIAGCHDILFRRPADGAVFVLTTPFIELRHYPKAARHNQPIKKSRPPIGVMAPSVPTPVSASV